MSALFLFLRIGLFALAGQLGAFDFVTFDDVAGSITVSLEGLAESLDGIALVAGTFVSSRVAKWLGWKT